MTTDRSISAQIRTASTNDAAAVALIYNHYVLDTIVTFEETPVTAAEMSARIAETQAASLPWLVADELGTVAGYALATRWKGRCSYRFSVEVTVYLDPSFTGRGLGSQLYEALFAELRARRLHVAIGGIALPNPASVALHEKFGLKQVAHFSQVGFKFGRWVDVGYWQIVLDEPAPR